MVHMPSQPARGDAASVMTDNTLDDLRSTRPVERLLEDSWKTRSRRVSRRELVVESLSSILFLALAIPMALSALGSHSIEPLLAGALMILYALSCLIKFPIGAGYVVPSYMVLVPMLLLLPPGLVPLLTASSLVVVTLVQALARREEPERAFFAISDCWHTLGLAAVLVAAGPFHDALQASPLVYLGAFVAGCVVDLIAATVRESAILGIGSRVQIRVIGVVWIVDACIAPLGLLVAYAAHRHHAGALLLIPFNGLLLMISRERTARITQAQRRLDLIARERTRLQTAVHRLGEALAAKLDLEALTNIVLRGSVEALDADAGRLVLEGLDQPHVVEIVNTAEVSPGLDEAVARTLASEQTAQVQCEGSWALALPLGFSGGNGRARGALAVARADRPFREDEEEVIRGLVEQARQAATDIIAHQLLREQALSDSLTGLGNRRKLQADLEERQPRASTSMPLVLILFDLDGFKSYNDTFGHLAGDAVLARLGAKLAQAVRRHGTAYRLGGDEFCVLAAARASELHGMIADAAGALEERGEKFAVGASYGAVLIPHEATTLDYALQLADQRMYARKKRRPSVAGDQARDVLMRIMHARQPSLEDHSSEVARLCVRVGRRFGMTAEELDELWRAAELHDVGKVGIPDAILEKPRELDAAEWEFMRQHTILGERILSAAPALRPVAVLVRATHERWDGKGYPDGLGGDQIPLGARIIAACDAYEAMTSDRVYRRSRDHEAACRELRLEAGRQFDPDVVEALLAELRLLHPKGRAAQRALGAPDTRAQATEEVVASLRAVLERHQVRAES
jgi:diguanylate cyclase (GGDEF)-like protein